MSHRINISILIILLITITVISKLYALPGVCEFDPILEKLRMDAIKIESMSNLLDFYPSDESYTEDKKRIFLCLKDTKGKYYDYNHLIQVLVHELAHAFSTVVDKQHKTPEFNNLHTKYRSIAIQKNLLDPADGVPSDYCKKN